MMIDIVLDTNIIVSAALKSNSHPRKVLDAFLKKRANLYYSEGIYLEYIKVLFNEKFNFDRKTISVFLEVVEKQGFYIEPVRSKHFMIDEDDRIFYDTARRVNGILITGNLKHFPEEDFIISPSAFCRRFNI